MQAGDTLKLRTRARSFRTEEMFATVIADAGMSGHKRVPTAWDVLSNLKDSFRSSVRHMIDVDDHAEFHHCLDGQFSEQR